jgi:hypothetical protein
VEPVYIGIAKCANTCLEVFDKVPLRTPFSFDKKLHRRERAGVHAPTKSVSVVLIFHVTLWPGSTRGRQDKVIATTTDMSA